MAAIHEPFVTSMEKLRSVSLEILSLLYFEPSRYAGPRDGKVLRIRRDERALYIRIAPLDLRATAWPTTRAPDMLSMSYCRSMRYWPGLKINVFVTATPSPLIHVSGTRSSVAPGASVYSFCGLVYSVRCVGRAPPSAP